MSLGGKLWLAFGLIALFAVGLAAYGVRALSSTGDLVVRLYDEPLMGVNYARAASATLSQARGLMAQTLMLDGADAPGADAALRQMQTAIGNDLRIVRQRVHNPAVADALDRAEQSIGDLFGSERLILAPPAGGVTALPMPALVQRQSAAAAARLDDLVEQVAADGFAFRTRAQAEIQASSTILASLSGSVIVISALFVLLFGQLLIRPIRAATRIAENVAAGNNAPVVTTRRRDEFGRLLTSLATMQASLRSRDAEAVVLLQAKDQAAERLRQINLRFDTALNNMSHGLLMCDADARVVVFNRRFCEVNGIDPDDLSQDATYSDVVALSVAAGNYPGRSFDDVFAAQTDILRSRQPVIVARTNTAGRSVEISYQPMPDGGWIAIHSDITERRRSEEQIVFLARHDALTRLPNRVLFQERLNLAFAGAERDQGFALLYVDLDRFKAVNDTLGHPAGDGVLCAVALRLQAVVREVDTIARLGGDEFAILQMGSMTQVEASVLAGRVIEAVSRPYEIDGHQIIIGASVGIALAPADGAHPAQLVKNADLALYRAKQEGRNTWRFFEPGMDALAQTRRELELDLRAAMLLGQFELYYQPLVSSRGRSLTGFEVLLRWHHPARGMVSPGEFIAATEELGLIVPLGAWVMRQAFAEAAGWPAHLRLAVNLSPLQVRDQALLQTVDDALNATGMTAARVEFEITESVLLQDNQPTRSTLHALHALGARIALDDFGTGYSSLSYLRSFPFDTIKIDGSFVAGLQTRQDSVAIVRAIIGLGSSLHMHTTAEGVETAAQFEFLVAAGCTEVQGYLFSKPVPASALPALIERLSRSRPAPSPAPPDQPVFATADPP